MRVLTGCLFIAFLVAVYNNTYAQSGLSGIHGKVWNERHLAAEAANVILLAAADTSFIKSTACDANGLFNITVKPGKYLLLISRIGYQQSLSGPYELENDKDVSAGEIALMRSTPQLKEVSITAQREYVEVRPDRLILNVQSSIIAEDNSVIDILKQAPGVHADNHGNISIIGRQPALITIDGKKVNGNSPQDIADMLQGIPGSTIQQIELITSPSAKYDASSGGVINIVTKKGSNAGTNVTVTAGAGYGKFYKANAGINFNNRMGIMNVFGGYNYSNNKTDKNFTEDRIINYKNVLSDYDVNYYATQQSYNHNFRVGTDLFLSPKHTIGVLVSGTVTGYDYEKNNVLNIANQGILDSTISTKSKLNRGFSNISYDINYSGKLDTTGKMLSVDLVYNDVDRHSSEYIDNYFYNTAGNNYRPSLSLQNISPSELNIWVAKVDYVNPLSKTAQLEGGIKYSSVKSNNQMIFGPKVNGVYQSSPNFSNTFIFSENINSAYINYTNKIGKVDLMAGLRAEQTNSNGNSVTRMTTVKKNYLDLFPHVQLNYRADEKNEFGFSFDRGITRAAYESVNPFLYYVDLYDYRAGNPNLLPQYANKIQLSHTYNKTFVTTLYGSIVTNFYDMVDYIQNDSSKVNITTAKNFGTYAVIGLKFYAPVEFNGWWSANFTTDLAYQRFKAYPANGNLNKGTPDFTFTTMQSFKINSTINAELTGKYESPNFYGIGQNKSVYHVDAGISKQLFNKNGSLHLSINDIFNTLRDRATVNYQNVNMSIYDKPETRIVRLGFTYRFGNISLKGTSKHNAGNEEEQQRAAGGIAGGATAN